MIKIKPRYSTTPNSFKYNYVVLRDVDLFEQNQVISKYNIRCISTSQLTNNDLDELLDKDKFIHISLNVDSTNPKTEISSSIQRGLTCEQIKTFIRTITKYNQLISFDITELNLQLGS